MRVNARIDDEHAEKLRFLARTTESTVSDVLKRAIDVYYAQMRESQHDALAVMRRAGFIGVAEGDPSLSSDYKSALAHDLDRKHGHR